MAGLTKHARDKLLAELRSGTITSGPATFTLGEAPPGFKVGGWPTHGAPCEGFMVDNETGQAWRVRFNTETKQWEIVDEVQSAGAKIGYVTWDYEVGADPPYYHIFSTDAEPEALELDGTLFTIATPQSAEMDALIVAVCDALEAAIAHAAQQLTEE